jgi:hypothetical protein
MMGAAALAMGGATSALAQVKTVDPNQAIDSDLAPAPRAPQTQQPATSKSGDDAYRRSMATPAEQTEPNADSTRNTYSPPPPQQPQPAPSGTPGSTDQTVRQQTMETADTYDRNDLMSAAEGVFGKGAEGLAGILQKILSEQGQPNAYIAGREASGAFVVGLRYGSGVLYSKIEGQQPVYWTGPSVGFDVGGDANKVFVLVYNLYDSEELFKRFPQGEGHLYFVGGFSASYLRSGNVVLIPVRLGVGWRAGVNVGYMKFSHHEKWLPF